MREVREETGFQIRQADVGEPLWYRDVFYTYRGERRLQHESVCVARIAGTAPAIDTTGRDRIEMEDHLLNRWWRVEELLVSEDRFYPRRLPCHIEELLAGRALKIHWSHGMSRVSERRTKCCLQPPDKSLELTREG